MKKHTLLLIIPILLFSLNAQTQDTVKLWKSGGVGSLNFNQVNLSNWAAGGQSSLSAGAFMNLNLNYKKDKTTWDNTVDLAYGLTQIGDEKIRKSDDKIDFNSKYGRQAYKKLFYSALVNFKTQFTDGYNYPNDSIIVSGFMAPAYLLLSMGMDYKPAEFISIYVSPLTGKITIVNLQQLADAGAFGVDTGKSIRKEFGAYTTISLKKEIGKNVMLTTKLDLFSNYSHHPQNLDVNWDAMIAFKVNKFITANISTTLIYDEDIKVPVIKNINGKDTQVGTGPRTQFKEVFGLGLSYKF